MLTTTDLPKFPSFKGADEIQIQSVKKIITEYPPYSDFNLTSVIAWSDGKAEISQHNNNLILRIPSYLDTSIAYSVLGTNRIDETLLTVLSNVPMLSFVPQTTVDAIEQPISFQITEDRDNFDYIYETDKLTRLEGAKYKKLRNKLNLFIKDHRDKEVVLQNSKLITEQVKDVLLSIDKSWSKTAKRTSGDILTERRALSRLIAKSDSLNLEITIMYVGGKPKAFSINEILGEDYAICHFEKALHDHHTNTATYLTHEVAKHLHAMGVKYINWEQDLGLEGLRHSKLSYRPSSMLKKFVVRANPKNL